VVGDIGQIARLQVQAMPLKTPGEGYDPGPIVSVERAVVSRDGVLGWDGDRWVVDAHNATHPDVRGRGNRALSVGFSGHYEAMAGRFGWAPLGIAGENIIIDGPGLRLDRLGGGLTVRAAAGEVAFTGPAVATPCVEFTSFLKGASAVLPRTEITDDLAFLDAGTRGYILDVTQLGEPVEIRVGDPVAVI